MTKSGKNILSARVTHVDAGNATSPRVIVMIGDVEHELDWVGQLPAQGDIYLVRGDHPPQIIEKIGAASGDGWSADNDALRWRKRNGRGQSRMDALWQRHLIRRSVRDYLDGEGFIEIDAPLLVAGTTPDATIQSFPVLDRYLVTSTEYQIKRLEAGGFDRIYTLTQNYRRDDGEGAFRNQEFTMLEWARVGQDLKAIENDAEQLTWRAHKALGGNGMVQVKDHKIDLTPPWPRVTVREALQTHAGVDLKDFSFDSISKAVRAARIPLANPTSNDKYFLFSLLMDHIQPRLGLSRPVFVCDWPAFETSSTDGSAGSETAERSELFIGGIEISDGFPTLTNADRQKTLFEDQAARRLADGLTGVGLDEAYLSAVRVGLPKGAGMALGFDRLVMALTDRPDIKSVLAFAWDELA